MNKYADLHLHVSLKHYVNELGNIWYTKTYREGKEKPNRSKAQEFTQSDVTTLIKGNVDLSVIALYPLEDAIDAFLVNRIVGKLFFGFKSKKVKQLRALYPTKYDLLNHEKKFVLDGPFKKNEKLEYLVAKQASDLSKKPIKLVLSIEGGHSLHHKADPKQDNDGILNRLSQIKNWDYPVFMLTICHFEYNELAGQAWAIPLPGVSKPLLRKTLPTLTSKGRAGITDLGKTVIKKALDTSNGNRILIDLKHSSAETRREYYRYLKDEGLAGEVPVIASHMGASGIKTFDEQINHVCNEKANEANRGNKYPKFNPWAINLCDEDITIIIGDKDNRGLGGIIGVSLDQRIIGKSNKTFKKSIKRNLKKIKIARNKENWHTCLFLENLFHIVATAEREEAWKMMCLSSDNDGIIDPIDSCPTAAHLQRFEKRMQTIAFRYLLASDYKDRVFVNSQQEMNARLRAVLYDNLNNFVTEHFPR